jgi:hypothetical protein
MVICGFLMTISGHEIMWPRTQKGSPMYRVSVGYYHATTFEEEWESVLDAMDFADTLVLKHGFEIAYVLDERNQSEYHVEDRTPRTMDEQDARHYLAQRYMEEHANERIKTLWMEQHTS